MRGLVMERIENIGGMIIEDWSRGWGCGDWGWWWPRIVMGWGRG